MIWQEAWEGEGMSGWVDVDLPEFTLNVALLNTLLPTGKALSKCDQATQMRPISGSEMLTVCTLYCCLFRERSQICQSQHFQTQSDS